MQGGNIGKEEGTEEVSSWKNMNIPQSGKDVDGLQEHV
jgi:hypothetical protein